MVEGHKIKSKVGIREFFERIKKYKPENIICTLHTFLD